MKEKSKEEKDKEIKDATDIVAERLAKILLEYYYWSKGKKKKSKEKDFN